MGGALGNIVDRLTRVGEVGSTATGFMSGAVVDFIDLQWWPVFNIADAAVVCGGIALAILSARVPAEERSAPTADAVDDAGAADAGAADPGAADLADEPDPPRP